MFLESKFAKEPLKGDWLPLYWSEFLAANHGIYLEKSVLEGFRPSGVAKESDLAVFNSQEKCSPVPWNYYSEIYCCLSLLMILPRNRK